MRRRVVLAGHTGDGAIARAGLRHELPDVRVAALGALARQSLLAADDLVVALDDGSAAVRRRAAELAVAFAVPLDGALADSDALVVEAACWACGEREDPGPVVRLVALAGGHEDPLVREAAVAALGAIGAPEGLPAILTATGDKPAVRRRAVLALAPFEGPEVEQALARARTDRDWQVRQAAEDLS